MLTIPVPETTIDTIVKHNPATGEVLAKHTVHSDADIDAAIALAQQSAQAWQAVPLAQRQKVMHHWAELILEEADTIAQTLVAETGKPYREAYENDVMVTCAALHGLAKLSTTVIGKGHKAPNAGWLLGRVATEYRVPKGVVAVITPWNYPLSIPAIGLCTALLAGNTVVFKPSEETLATARHLETLFYRALTTLNTPAIQALPKQGKDTLKLLVGKALAGQRIVQHPAIQHVLFTGSTQAGQWIHQACAARGIRCTLELGGNDPAIVLADAENLDAISSQILWGRCTNAGQACAAVKRVLVHQSRYRELVDYLTYKMAHVKPGKPIPFPASAKPVGQAPLMGPLINATQREKFLAQVQAAQQAGGRLLVGGSIVEGQGYFVQPGLMTELPANAAILQEEIFGPLLCVLPFETDDEAVILANNTPYGLGASVFGPAQHTHAVANQLNAGMVGINELPLMLFALPRLPWVGHKQSGLGAGHGRHGFEEVTHCRVQVENILAGWKLPILQKAPWLYGKPGCDSSEYTRSMLQAWASGHWTAWLNLKLLRGLWQHRDNTRL